MLNSSGAKDSITRFRLPTILHVLGDFSRPGGGCQLLSGVIMTHILCMGGLSVCLVIGVIF